MERDPDILCQKISSEEREWMIRSFAACLDRALEDEQPPEGLTAELISALRNDEPLPSIDGVHASKGGAGQGCDLYSLWAAMTVLSQEIRLQGRMFKQLNEMLMEAQKHDVPGPEAMADAASIEGLQPPPADSGQPPKQEIDVLLDLRDRMDRGIATARQAAIELAPTGLPRLVRWLGVGRSYASHVQDVFVALSHGYTLALERLDEALVACGVDRIPCVGRIFDPQSMTAVDIEETSDVSEGTVTAVYREGYEWTGTVYRAAQVRVARKPRE